MVKIVVIVSNINNSFSWILNILLFLHDNAASPFKKMFLVQYFDSIDEDKYDHKTCLHEFAAPMLGNPVYPAHPILATND